MAATAELVVPKSMPTTFSPGATSARAATLNVCFNVQFPLACNKQTECTYIFWNKLFMLCSCI